MSSNIVSKLYIILFFLLSLGVFISFVFPLGIKLYLFDFPIIILSSIACYIIWFNKINLKTFYFIPLFLITGFIGLLFYVSSVPQLFSSSAYLFRLLLYLLLAVPIIILNAKQLKQILYAIFVSGIFFLAFGYVQYVFYPDLANLYYLGWDRHLFRYFSSFLDPNFAGIYLILLYFFSLSIFFKSGNKNQKKIFLVLSTLFIPAIFLTYSRTAYVSFFLGTFVLLYFLQKKLLLVGIGIFVLILFLLPKNFGGEGVNLFRTSSIISRLSINESALTLFINNPFVGVGYNSLKYAYIQENVLDLKNLDSHSASGVPNSYIYILATTGLIGFSFFAGSLLYIIRFIVSVQRQSSEFYFSRFLLSGVVVVLVGSLFDNVLFFAPIFILLIIWLSILGKMKMLNSG